MTCPHCQAPNADDARFCGVCGRATSATEPTSNPSLGEAPTLIGREIAGRYRMLAKLGEGGMGAVYKAEQLSLKRTVAVKLLRPEVASSQMLLRRFNAEAEAVAKLSHPNTVNIYDFGQDADGTLFIAMEYIEGASLRAVIQREAPLPLRRALGIAIQVASSLTDAHAQGIIHRDLKPDNVMIQERGRQRDVVRVLDFGIAKLRDDNRQSQLAMTQAGDMLGTPQYMAPEQIRAEAIDGRTDVYALGCLLYEMVTGRLPFEAPTVMSLLSKHLLEVSVPPSQRRPDLGLPPAIDHLILSAMAKDPNVRPPTMEAFGEQLAALHATMPGDSAPHTAQPHTAQQPSVGSGGMIPTPVAYSAIAPGGGAASPPPAPPPPGPAPAAGGYAAPPSGGHAPPASGGYVAPSSGGYVPPAPGAPAYDPHAVPPPDAQPRPPARSSNAALWIVLGVLAVGGAGAGIYFGVVRPSSSAAGAAGADPGSASNPSGTPDPAPGGIDAGPPSISDPWAGGAGTAAPAVATPPPAPPPPARAAFATKLMQGVTLDLPRGFTVQQRGADGFVATDRRGVGIIAGPITERSNDIQVLASVYAKDTGLVLHGIEYDVIAGERRAVATFQGEFQGVPAVHMVTALIGPGYRVAVAVHMPIAAAEEDETILAGAIELFTSRLAVP